MSFGVGSSARPEAQFLECVCTCGFYHSLGHVVAKLFDLFSDIFEESVTGPTANHPYGVDWAFV